MTPGAKSRLHLEPCLSPAHGRQDRAAVGLGPGEDGSVGWGSVVVHHLLTLPVCVETMVTEPEGIRDAPSAPQVPASASHGETVAVVYRGAAAGGNLAAALAGLLTEAALQAEGRCQQLRQPRVPHLGTAFFFFPQLCLHQCLHWFPQGSPNTVAMGPPHAI